MVEGMRRLAVLLLLAGAVAASPDDLCARFTGFDRNGDGIVEIDALTPVAREDGPGADAPLVLMLFEGRLLDVGRETVLPSLRRWQRDVAAEGFRSALVEADLYRGPVHQDGETLLALREFLRAVRAEDRKLAGVVLVGAFPEAYLVRSVNWRKRGKVKIGGKKFAKPVRYLRTIPEGVAHTCDLVLADLDGHWERLYTQPRTKLPSVAGVFPDGVPADGGITLDYERGTRAFEDFFHVDDGHFDVQEIVWGPFRAARLTPLDDLRDEECSAADRERPNVIAHPDILVSRLNPRGVATSPDMERRLLFEYFERNHGYRTGALEVPFRPASLAHSLGSGYRVLQRASKNWSGPAEPGLDVRGKPSFLEAYRWLERPAVLRTIRAHTNRVGSVFRHGWLSCKGLRRGWVNGMVANDTASFYIHVGCEAISPAKAERKPYSDPAYGRDNSAAALLFFAHGLALVGRAKVFYDEPRGFCAALAKGKTFGAAWARYFEIESRAKSWGKAGGDIGRKRSYFWSVLGDWTLRLRKPG